MDKKLLGGWLCLTLCGAVACQGDPNTAEYWTKQLEEKKTRESALKEILKDRKAIHVDGVIAVSKDADDPKRPEVAQLLGQLGEKFPENKDRIGAALVEMVDYGVGGATDKVSRQKNYTNKAVADAITRLRYQPGADALTRLVDSKENNTRLAAVTGLGVVKSPAAVDKLISVVEDDENNFMVKNAIKALGHMGDAKAVPALVHKMFFERGGVSFYSEASYALFQIGKPAVAPLVETLAGKTTHMGKLATKVDPWIVKAKCVQVLVDIGDPKGAEGAITVLKSADTGEPSQLLAKSFVIRPTGQAGAKEAAPLLRPLASNIDISQAEVALEALQMLGDRAYAGDALKGSTKEGFFAECKKEYDDEQCKGSEMEVRQLRLQTATRLGGGGDLAAVEKMEAAEKDAKLKEMVGKEKVRLVAAKECGENVACWVGKLKDANAKVRDKAAWELAWRKDASTAPAMLAALTDGELHVRAALFVGLLRVLPKDGADTLAKQLDAEASKVQFQKINQDLARLEIKMRRGY